MVGVDTKDHQKLSSHHYAIAGGCSGFITRMVCQPLDVLKIRFQLQVEPINQKLDNKAKYRGFIQATHCILKEEGVLALWKGHVPAQTLSVVYGISQFVAFEITTRFVWKNAFKSDEKYKDSKPVIYLFCGGISGCVATLFAQPFDIVRTRLVAQGEPKIYKGFLNAIYCIATKEGLLAFYKGLTPTLIQIFPYAGAQFCFYRLFKDIWEKNLITEGLVKNMTCAASAGICAKTVVYPLDLCKKRLQIQGFETARVSFGRMSSYSNFIDCFKKIVKEEGKMGLYKGYFPSLIKAASTTALSFTAYEQICYLFQKYIAD